MKPKIVVIASAVIIPIVHSATLVSEDTTTQGNWGGTYGSDGYMLFAYNGALRTNNRDDLASLPDYVSEITTTLTGYTWGSPNPNPVPSDNPQFNRVLENPAGPLVDRRPATLFNGNGGTITINLNAPRSFQIAVYSLDWDFGRSAQTVQVTDQNGESEVQTLSNSIFRDGAWGVFEVSGDADNPVVITLTKAGAGSNAVIGGIMFGSGSASAETPEITAISHDPSANTVTLTWRAEEDAAYLAQYSLTLDDGWIFDLDDDLGFSDDEVADDGDHITKTFDLSSAGLETKEKIFFRIGVQE